jgi:hypothetical protein
VKDSPPENGDVSHTLSDLLDTIGDGDPDESATIVGVGGEDEE